MTNRKIKAAAGPVYLRVKRHARCWRDSGGLLEEVQQYGDKVRVVRGLGYVHQNTIACELTDTGNGFVVHFPGTSSCDLDHCFSLDYAQARELVLALTPHAKELGFAA